MGLFTKKEQPLKPMELVEEKMQQLTLEELRLFRELILAREEVKFTIAAKEGDMLLNLVKKIDDLIK